MLQHIMLCRKRVLKALVDAMKEFESEINLLSEILRPDKSGLVFKFIYMKILVATEKAFAPVSQRKDPRSYWKGRLQADPA